MQALVGAYYVWRSLAWFDLRTNGPCEFPGSPDEFFYYISAFHTSMRSEGLLYGLMLAGVLVSLLHPFIDPKHQTKISWPLRASIVLLPMGVLFGAAFID